MILGVTTNLRAIELDDAQLVHAWFNAPAVMDGWGLGVAAISRTIAAERVAGWIDLERTSGRPVAFIIERSADSGPLGLLLAIPLDDDLRIVRLSLLIGEPNDWGHGYAGDALDAFLEAAFDGWNLHSVELEVEEGNARAERLYRSTGFQQEVLQRQHRFRAGVRRDVAMMALTADRWRSRGELAPSGGAAQGPRERFDVLLGDGEPAGYTKPRREVHRDGDWHRSIHVWICGIEADVPFLDIQRRGLKKDTWPGAMDATVGGHLGAGETIDQAFREIEEEIGLVVDPSDLVHAGTRRGVTEQGSHLRDREIQEVHLLRREGPITAYRPNVDELDGIARIAIDELIELMTGAREQIPARFIASGSLDLSEIQLSERDFIPAIDRYFLRIAIAARGWLAGETPVVV